MKSRVDISYREKDRKFIFRFQNSKILKEFGKRKWLKDIVGIEPEKIVTEDGKEKILGVVNKYNLASRYEIIFGNSENGFIIDEFFLFEAHYYLENLINDKPFFAKVAEIALELREINEYIKTKTWVSERYNIKEPKLELNKITRKLKFKPLEHQITAIKNYLKAKQVLNLRGYMYDLAAGLGKTYTALATGELLDYDRFLLVVPRQVLENVWIKSITESLYKEPQDYIVLSNKTKDIKKERFILTHYEFLEKVVEDKKLMRKLKNIKPILIVDEFHNFNEISAKRTRNLMELANYVDFEDIILLTGTPIKFDVDELVPMLNILDRKFSLEISKKFVNLYKYRSGIVVDMFDTRYDFYRIRINKEDDQLPPITIEEFKIKLPDKIAKKYTLSSIYERIQEYTEKRLKELNENYDKYFNEFLKLVEKAKKIYKSREKYTGDVDKLYEDYIALVKKLRIMVRNKQAMAARRFMTQAKEFEAMYIEKYLEGEDLEKFRDIKSIVKYPELKVLGESLGRIVMRSRIDCYKELAMHIDYKKIAALTDKKFLVFSNYIEVCEVVYSRCNRQLPTTPLRVYGEFTDKLHQIVEEFYKDDKKNPLIATYQSLSTGVPVTAANIVLMFDLPFRMYIFDQSVSRVHRLGQDKKVVILISRLDTDEEPNITERNIYILNLSKMKVEMITNNKFPYDLFNVTLKNWKKEKDDEEKVEDGDNEVVDNVVKNEMIRSLMINESNESYLSKLINGFIEKIKIKIQA